MSLAHSAQLAYVQDRSKEALAIIERLDLILESLEVEA